MKLNLDCIRSVLMRMEKADFQESLSMQQVFDSLPDYSEDEITYCTSKLFEAGFIEAVVCPLDGRTIIVSLDDITYNGHQFLANIRSNKIWKQVKDIATDIGSDSLPSLVQIALKVVSSAISGYFAT